MKYTTQDIKNLTAEATTVETYIYRFNDGNIHTDNVKVNTLEKFAGLINESDEWRTEFYDIIEANGWADDTGDTYGVCHSGTRWLVLDERAQAVVVER